MKKRRKPLSWRTCPKCMSRATKMFSLDTGKYQCQACDHEYEHNPPSVLALVGLQMTATFKVPSDKVGNEGDQR